MDNSHTHPINTFDIFDSMEEVKKMNRLILLGNGFDLAHGLKTGYNNFILWYLKYSFNYAFVNKEHDDPLINVKVEIPSRFNIFSSIGINSVCDFIDHFYKEGFNSVLTTSIFKFETHLNDFYNPFTIHVKDEFLRKIITNCSSATWVEIENAYYSELKAIFNKPPNDKRRQEITQLNNGFAHLIELLQHYLKNIVGTNGVNLNYREIITSPFEPDEFTQFYPVNTVIDETMIVNFNYTTTVTRYLGVDATANVNLNFIHGMLDMEDNPIIFGFGDEMDKVYSDFETHEIMGQFDYFKSFLYLQTSNYYNLLRFIESNEYQVYIVGHSCGLSDRTMLNMIFEHANCKSIKIFFHETAPNKNNYTALTQEIARHFKDKQTMRGRIVSLDKSEPMPQFEA